MNASGIYGTQKKVSANSARHSRAHARAARTVIPAKAGIFLNHQAPYHPVCRFIIAK